MGLGRHKTIRKWAGGIGGKLWKIRYCLEMLAIGSLPRRELIMNYIAFSVPWMAIIIEYTSILFPCVDRTIQSNA